jgi:hypothetical protein
LTALALAKRLLLELDCSLKEEIIMKPCTFVALAVGCTAVAIAATAPAQVVVRGTESSDNSATRSEVNIVTMDRSVVPLIKESQQTKIDENTERTETVTRDRRNDGSYFDSQRSTTLKKQISPEVTEVSTAVVEKDRQGNDRTTGRTTQTVVKNDQGETSQVKTFTRNSSGQLMLDRVVDANTVTSADGRANTTRVEKVADVSGNIVVQKQIEETAVQKGPNEKVTTALTKSVDHRTGLLDVTGEATTTVRTENGTKQIDTVVRTPGRTGWQVSGRTTTTERTAPDGSVIRETVEQGRSLYSTRTGDQMMEPLVPQRKTVEQEARNADGTVIIERDVFRRDVNGEWKRESFSTEQPTAGVGQCPPPPPPVAEPVATPEPAPPPPLPN